MIPVVRIAGVDKQFSEEKKRILSKAHPGLSKEGTSIIPPYNLTGQKYLQDKYPYL